MYRYVCVHRKKHITANLPCRYKLQFCQTLLHLGWTNYCIIIYIQPRLHWRWTECLVVSSLHQTIWHDGSGWMSMYCTTDILRLDTGFCSTVLNLNGNYQNIIYHILYVLSLCTCNQLASSILCTVFASTMSAVCVSVQTMFFVDLFGKKTLYLIIATNGMRIKNYLWLFFYSRY